MWRDRRRDRLTHRTPSQFVITGFNTDIEHDGVVYHVQTEDKGLETPLILSLVYDRGTILASKRSPYDDLIKSGFDEKVLAERLQKQHKLICAAVRAGRIEDLKKMTAKESAAKRAGVATKPSEKIAAPSPKNTEPVPVIIPSPAPVARPIEAPVATVVPVAVSAVSLNADTGRPVAFNAPIPQPDEELVWELPMKIIDDEIVVEPDGVVTSEAIGDTIVLDDAIKYVEPIPTFNGKLEIEFAAETTFKAGERKTLQIYVHRGDPTNRLVGVPIVVKVLGSSFRPLIFHAKTESSGVATIHLQLPQFRSGRAALLVRALDNGEEAELRQIVRQS